MTTYKCGHESSLIIMNTSILGLSSYLTWKDTTGNNGSKEECFNCYCSRHKKQIKSKDPFKKT